MIKNLYNIKFDVSFLMYQHSLPENYFFSVNFLLNNFTPEASLETFFNIFPSVNLKLLLISQSNKLKKKVEN